MNPLKDDGGPAFPLVSPQGDFDPKDGMSLRDYFAAQVVSGCGLWPWQDTNQIKDFTIGAEFAYKVADALLAARGKKAEGR